MNGADRVRKEYDKECLRAISRQRALDDVAKKAQAIERADCVDSCNVERAINETYYKITFNQRSIPRGFFEDYGLKFESAAVVNADTILGPNPLVKRLKAVATKPEDGSP